MYRIKIINGTDLSKMEMEANKMFTEISNVSHVDSSMLYCAERKEYVMILGMDIPECIAFEL